MGLPSTAGGSRKELMVLVHDDKDEPMPTSVPMAVLINCAKVSFTAVRLCQQSYSALSCSCGTHDAGHVRIDLCLLIQRDIQNDTVFGVKIDILCAHLIP